MEKITNVKNAQIIREFYQFMKSINAGEKHINNNLKIITSLANALE